MTVALKTVNHGPPVRARVRFREITETARTRADPDQFAMSQLRHSLVAEFARDRDLLDVTCGSGYALPLIARSARSVTGCDRDGTNATDARAALGAASICVANAERPPFRAGCFDVVACLEAIYYFQDWQRFIGRAVGLLRAGGTLIVSWPNPARPAFHASPGSTVYPDMEQMLTVANQAGCEATCYGAFPLESLATARSQALDGLRRAAVRLHLIPDSLRLRGLIKHVLYGRLRPLSQLGLIPRPIEELVKLRPGANARFAMLYLVARTAATTELP